ncbi:DNA-directed RNA polymerase subunit beta' [Candidatus Pelagibacter sp. RS40]|uniref:DNA-directed RNA polymerase subunit beta' n=1 Tax=Candidatus Pelagibacter sp. RS40 TaxID=1977865 RepID=UPI000A14A34D|nr:DNA-directed RNA polymerase subunit beta' [Candidatus Pelagibacter sp. RS40]ARJ49634.1 DNA-directed RNA polymerase subunit beta' [Candidatus Pelagibacter sp. RS40]
MSKELTDLFKGSEISEAQNFNSIKITLASPEKIKSWTYGEIKKPETINYRTFRPEKDGLFCARIFGPIKDYECLCGKYKRMKFRGIICEKCGVEVTKSNVRRERMGHINLATPVAHIWFLKSLPSRISLAIDMKLKEVERVLYFENFIVIEPGLTGLKKNQLLGEEELIKYQDEYGEESFTAGIGAEAILEILKSINLEEEKNNLIKTIKETKSKVSEERSIKRLKLIESFIETGNKPEWMILTTIPVIPPELRPLVPLDGGRFATSDLNDLYRRVINRNNRLKRLMDLKAPDIIVRNEKRMLQESVDALFDNGRRGRVITGTGKRPLKSLAEMLKGKQGRFRQNLLGKRVDYSGRSVIVVGPDLKLHECGLPKKMALELFKPFLYARLNKLGLASTIKQAKKLVERERNEVWDALELIVREHPVILNRAPTLHRLGVQAFEPKLIEGNAIELHPLTCAAFNADFDGDQMAVHVPLSLEAQLEARVLMMSTNNILSPSNGKPIIVPSQDMILGIYYLSQPPYQKDRVEGYFVNTSEIEHALEIGQIKVHSRIVSRFETVDEKGNTKFEKHISTAGRFLLSNLIPKNVNNKFSLVDRLLPKKVVSEVIDHVFRFSGQKSTVIFCDKLKDLGFKHAFKAGISFGKDDLVIPDNKQQLIDETKKLISDYENQYAEGLITRGEKYNKVIDAWSKCTDRVASEMMKRISATEVTEDGLKINSVFMMADSGARGSAAQMKQLAGMRGLIAKPSGEIIESPITSNFKEGLTALEYFNSTHGARKGLADTALKTASSGYLTRRLCDVAQDLTITKQKCDKPGFIKLSEVLEGGNIMVSLSERSLGRVTAKDVKNPLTGDVIIKKGQMIDEAACEKIDAAGVKTLSVYSVMTCSLKEGVCATCYGRDLSRGKMVHVGEAIGMISAQSIGEPGTQLTMRTFHVGGTASVKQDSQIVSSSDGILKIVNTNLLEDSKKNQIVMGRNTELSIEDGNGLQVASYKVPYGSKLFFQNDDKIKKGAKICEWDPYTTPVIAEKDGVANYVDLIDGVSLAETVDDATGISTKAVVDWKTQSKNTDLKPRITLRDAKGNVIKKADDNEARYYLVPDSILSVKDGQKISAGDVIARLPKETTKTKDITGGLPRVAELFEARKAKDSAIIAENDGKVIFGKEVRGKQRVTIESENGETSSYLIPKGKHINFNQGEKIKKGEYLLDGQPLPHDILRILGIEELTEYFVNQVQDVYRLQGVIINDKHIEVILRQMLKKIEVKEPGDSSLLPGEVIDRIRFEQINENLKAENKKPAVGERVLMGITKASLQTESFISAASFQETTRVLTDAAIKGKVDKLVGLKENVIVGRLVPAGTGSIKNNWNRKALDDDKKFLTEQETLEPSEAQINQ